MQAVFQESFGIRGFKRGALRHAITRCCAENSPGVVPGFVTKSAPSFGMPRRFRFRNSVRIKPPRLLHGSLQAKEESLHSQRVQEKPAQRLRQCPELI